MSELQHILREMPIFGGIEAASLDYIIKGSAIVSKRPGEYFFRQGDTADSMFVLEEGRVAVFRSHQGVQYKLRELSKGDCFGEMALMACSVRSASVCTIQPCDAIEIKNNLLADLYQHNPEQYTLIVMNMGREVCRRLEQADTRLFLQDIKVQAERVLE